jgi:hypothetical protein
MRSLGRQCGRAGGLVPCGGVFTVGQDRAGSSEDIKSQVAAAFDPLVMLFGQHGADEADDGGAVGEDTDDVGAAADFLVKSLLPPGTLTYHGAGDTKPSSTGPPKAAPAAPAAVPMTEAPPDSRTPRYV